MGIDYKKKYLKYKNKYLEAKKIYGGIGAEAIPRCHAIYPVEINKNTYKIDYKNIKDGLYYEFHNEKKDVVGFHLTWNDLEQHYELDYEKNLLDEWKSKGSRDVYAIGKEKKIFKINNKKYIFQPTNEQVYEELIFYNDNTGTHTRFEFPNTDDEEITTTHFKYTKLKPELEAFSEPEPELEAFSEPEPELEAFSEPE